MNRGHHTRPWKQRSNPEEKRRRNAAFLMFAMLALGTIAGCGSGPEGTVKEFFARLNSGDPVSAEELLLPAVEDENPVAQQARSMLLRNAQGGDKTMIGAACSAAGERGGYDVTVVDIQTEGDAAVVKVRLNFNWTYPPWETAFNLVKHDKEWQIADVPYVIVMTGMSLKLYGDMDTRVLIGLPQGY